MFIEHGGDIFADDLMNSENRILDFSANINPLGMPDEVKSAIVRNVDDYDHYPDIHNRALREAIAAHFNVDSSCILCGNGAAEVIYKLVFSLSPEKALVTAPTFSEYEEALAAAGCEVSHYMLMEEDDFDIREDIIDSIEDDTDIVFLCNPNNPTGRSVKNGLIERMLDKTAANGTVIVVDECFMDFIRDRKGCSCLGLVGKYKNLVILKAFTKTYAMAGIRLGYMICGDAGLVGKAGAFGPPWNISTPATHAGIAAMGLDGYEDKIADIVEKLRNDLEAKLEQLGLKVIKGSADYILFHTDIEDLDNKMRQRGILIRDCSNYTGLGKGWFRIAVKNRAENEIMYNTLLSVINDAKKQTDFE